MPGCSESTSRDDTVERRAHDGMVELALHLVHLRLRGPVLRQRFDRESQVAAELGELNLSRILERAQRVLRRLIGVARLVRRHRRNALGFEQRVITLARQLVEANRGLLCGDVALHSQIVVAHRHNGQSRVVEIGLRIVERDLEWQRIDAEQYLAGRDMLAFLHLNRLHETGYVGRHHQLAGMNVGIVGANITTTRQVKGQRDSSDKRDAADHQDAAQKAASVRSLSRVSPNGREPWAAYRHRRRSYRFAWLTWFYSPAASRGASAVSAARLSLIWSKVSARRSRSASSIPLKITSVSSSR